VSHTLLGVPFVRVVEDWEEPGAGGAPGSSQLGERSSCWVRLVSKTGTGVPCPYKGWRPRLRVVLGDVRSVVGLGGDGAGDGSYG
jgi:hypothetical protein